MTQPLPDPRWQSPLSHRQAVGASETVQLAELPHLGFYQLRGQADLLAPALKRHLGIILPLKVSETASNNGVSVLWLGPDMWLVAFDSFGQPETINALAEGLSGQHHQLVELSDHYTTIEVSGPQGRDLLAKLIAYDLHPRSFAAGQAVATVASKINVYLWMVEDAPAIPRIRLVVQRSLADHIWLLLVEGGRQWGLPPAQIDAAAPLHLPHFL